MSSMPLRHRLIEDVAYPLQDLFTGRRHAANRRLLAQSQWWPLERLREFQWQELSRLLDAAFSIPFYRDKYAAAGISRGDIRTWDAFSRLPSLTRQEVNQHRDKMRNATFKGRFTQSATGGSSGTPTRFFFSFDSYDWRRACRDRFYSWSGYESGDPIYMLWGAPIGRQKWSASLKQKLVDRTLNRGAINTFSQTESLWTRAYEEFLRVRPVMVTGYVSSLEGFCHFLEKTGRKVPPPKSVVSAAEPVFASTRELVGRVIGSPLYNNYGSREFMSIAAECERRDGLHVQAENLVVETDGPPGVPSPILVTDLHNYAMPFIRYEIGDAGHWLEGTCACGRSLPRLAAVEGRLLDLLRTPDGRAIPGEFFPHLLKDIPEIREFQVRQESLDRIVISAILSQPVSAASQCLLETEVGKVFGAATRVALVPVDDIPRLPSGKRRVTIGMS